jgi:hypothetical protein
MMRALNNQFKIATQPFEALVYLFQQLGAYYEEIGVVDPSGADVSCNVWVPYEHLQKFLHGTMAYPQVSIDEFSLRTVISYVKGNATWNPICKAGEAPWPPPNTGFVLANAPKVKFAYAQHMTVTKLLKLINEPSSTCTNEFSIFFNKSAAGEGATNYIAKGGHHGRLRASHYSGGTDIPPALDLKPDGGVVSNYGWILGYRLGSYLGATAYVSEGCYDGWGVKYIYIIVNDYNKNVNNFCIPSYNESMGRSNVLARVSTSAVASADYSAGISLANNVNQDNSLKKRIYFGPVDISRLELQITDELGRILDLNNMDYSMALNLICLYD